MKRVARMTYSCRMCGVEYDGLDGHWCSTYQGVPLRYVEHLDLYTDSLYPPIAPESVAGGYVLILVMVAVITALFGAALWLLTK